MFENLSEKLERSFKVLKGQGKITEINIAETLKEVRKALLDADVSYKIAKDFTTSVKEKALGQNVLTSLSPSQLMVKIVHDELVLLMGGDESPINTKGSPAIILIAGLQGSGKTTFSAKLANYLKTKKSKKVLLVADDVYRPAAIEQLKVLGQQIEVEVWSLPTATFGSFVANIPAPLGIGKIELEDNRWYAGFICESYALDTASDVTHKRGWRNHI